MYFECIFILIKLLTFRSQMFIPDYLFIIKLFKKIIWIRYIKQK